MTNASPVTLFWDPAHATLSTQGEMKDGRFAPAFENPDRMDSLLAMVTRRSYKLIDSVEDRGIDPIAQVHDRDYLEFLKEACALWHAAGRSGDVLPLVWPHPDMRQEGLQPPTIEGIDGLIGRYCFDNGTPIMDHSYSVSYGAAQRAIAAVEHAHTNQGRSWSVALVRPPGHHAMRRAYGGYCLINASATAAQHFLTLGHQRVAVLDIDYHHGNGTQDIFYDRGDVLVVNIHADPRLEYPYFMGHADETGIGEGKGTTVNLPLPEGTDITRYLTAVETAITAIEKFGATALVLSFGGDTFKDDPLGKFALEVPDYKIIGKAIGDLCEQENLAHACILEGGYASPRLGDIFASLLDGLLGA